MSALTLTSRYFRPILSLNWYNVYPISYGWSKTTNNNHSICKPSAMVIQQPSICSMQDLNQSSLGEWPNAYD